MVKKVPLPNQREGIILSILVLGEKYGREIRNDYETRTKHEMPLGSLYVTLDRMEGKGFISSRLSDTESIRGGNRRKYFKLTASGLGIVERGSTDYVRAERGIGICLNMILSRL